MAHNMLGEEIQQSPLYASYMQDLGWHTPKIDNVYVFIKRFPLIGGLAKLQRTHSLPDPTQLVKLLSSYGVRRLVVEPAASVSQQQLNSWCASLPKSIALPNSPYLATKTLLINLHPSNNRLFQSFTPEKRRAVRRAQKHNVNIIVSHDIRDLVAVKKSAAGLFGGITTGGLDKLWNRCAPKHAAILLATHALAPKPIAAVLLLFWKRTAYYWIAGASQKGKHLFAPSLLVWEALKLSKAKRCDVFDFVGAVDERRKLSSQPGWSGFTKFKEGFGTIARYYPLHPHTSHT